MPVTPPGVWEKGQKSLLYWPFPSDQFTFPGNNDKFSQLSIYPFILLLLQK